MYWVGRSDLELRFVVTDAGSGEPVADATIEIASKGGFYDEQDSREFVLEAGADGVASTVCSNSTSFGQTSWLGFSDTFSVHLPFWRYRGDVEGYEPGGWAELNVPEYRRQVEKLASNESRLTVSVPLVRSLSRSE